MKMGRYDWHGWEECFADVFNRGRRNVLLHVMFVRKCMHGNIDGDGGETRVV